jgi:hypothetical protein
MPRRARALNSESPSESGWQWTRDSEGQCVPCESELDSENPSQSDSDRDIQVDRHGQSPGPGSPPSWFCLKFRGRLGLAALPPSESARAEPVPAFAGAGADLRLIRVHRRPRPGAGRPSRCAVSRQTRSGSSGRRRGGCPAVSFQVGGRHHDGRAGRSAAAVPGQGRGRALRRRGAAAA